MRPWSFSRLNCAEECLQHYNWSYIERLPSSRPKSPAANRGQDIHKRAEDYLLGKLPIYPAELAKVSGHAMLLKRWGAKPEVKYAVKDDWTPTEFDDPAAYIRGILDVTHPEDKIVHIQDWKTGQVYAEHKDQLEVYVALVAPSFPEAEEFHTRVIYIDQGVVTPPKVASKARAEGMRIMLDQRIKKVEGETIFPARAGSHCRWCDYSKRFGGPCREG